MLLFLLLFIGVDPGSNPKFIFEFGIRAVLDLSGQKHGTVTINQTLREKSRETSFII